MALPVRRSVRNVVSAIIAVAAAFQLLIVPWNIDTPGMRAEFERRGVYDIMRESLENDPSYAPLWSPPVFGARVRVARFALQLGGVAAVLLLWVAATRPRDE